MALALLSILPQDVAQQVNGYTIQLSVTQRLANGWKEIHDEMNWRGGHADSCDFHWCPVQNCTCYHKFPGFLLRRVNSNWIPMNGTIMPSAMLELESQAVHRTSTGTRWTGRWNTTRRWTTRRRWNTTRRWTTRRRWITTTTLTTRRTRRWHGCKTKNQ